MGQEKRRRQGAGREIIKKENGLLGIVECASALFENSRAEVQNPQNHIFASNARRAMFWRPSSRPPFWQAAQMQSVQGQQRSPLELLMSRLCFRVSWLSPPFS